MGIIGNRSLQGQPILPYPQVKLYAGSDAFIDFTFTDHTQTPVIPSTFTWQLDDLTNDQSMVPSTMVSTITSPFYVLQIPASQMQMTFPYEGSQLCQLSFTAVAVDSVTGNPATTTGVSIIELCAIQTPNAL